MASFLGVDFTLTDFERRDTATPLRAVLGEPTPKAMACELTESVHRNVAIDRTVRQHMRAQVRVRVRHILRKYDYPPDRQEQVTQMVLEQAEVPSDRLAAA